MANYDMSNLDPQTRSRNQHPGFIPGVHIPGVTDVSYNRRQVMADDVPYAVEDLAGERWANQANELDTPENRRMELNRMRAAKRRAELRGRQTSEVYLRAKEARGTRMDKLREKRIAKIIRDAAALCGRDGFQPEDEIITDTVGIDALLYTDDMMPAAVYGSVHDVGMVTESGQRQRVAETPVNPQPTSTDQTVVITDQPSGTKKADASVFRGYKTPNRWGPFS